MHLRSGRCSVAAQGDALIGLYRIGRNLRFDLTCAALPGAVSALDVASGACPKYGQRQRLQPPQGPARKTGQVTGYAFVPQGSFLTPPPGVISIQSQVVFGHVGKSAALFPMQAAGLEVAAIPTVMFPTTPHCPTLRGCALDPALFADLLQGARERGLAERADDILTGHLGSVELARMVADFVAEAKSVNPRLIHLCDPVMGDAGPGRSAPTEVVPEPGYDDPTFWRTRRWLESERSRKTLF